MCNVSTLRPCILLGWWEETEYEIVNVLQGNELVGLFELILVSIVRIIIDVYSCPSVPGVEGDNEERWKVERVS